MIKAVDLNLALTRRQGEGDCVGAATWHAARSLSFRLGSQPWTAEVGPKSVHGPAVDGHGRALVFIALFVFYFFAFLFFCFVFYFSVFYWWEINKGKVFIGSLTVFTLL